LPLLPLSSEVGEEKPLAERADAAKNRERILRTARTLLATKNIADLAMDELAVAAGVGKGTLYRRFKDRASLCRALLDEPERELQERVLSGLGLGPKASAEDRCLQYLRELFRFAFDNHDLLAEAHAFERSVLGSFDSPPYQWRRRILRRFVEELQEPCMLHEMYVDVLLDTLLDGLRPEMLRWHRSRGGSRRRVLAGYETLWRHLLLGAGPPP
jgi:AcrR family transcriptional regulator